MAKKPIKSIYAIYFEHARKAYPGVKRGFNTEFEYFRKSHKDWIVVLPLLLLAIDQQVQRRETNRKSNKFVPPWKHFKTWIYNRSWEETEGAIVSPEEIARKKADEIENYKQKIREGYEGYLRSKSTPALIDTKKDKGQLSNLCGWLIDEILDERNRQRKEILG